MTVLRSRGGIAYSTAPRTRAGLKDTLLAGLDGAIGLFLERERLRNERRYQPTGQTESTTPTPTVRDKDPDDPPADPYGIAQYMPLFIVGIGAYLILR